MNRCIDEAPDSEDLLCWTLSAWNTWPFRSTELLIWFRGCENEGLAVRYPWTYELRTARFPAWSLSQHRRHNIEVQGTEVVKEAKFEARPAGMYQPIRLF